MKAAVQVLEDVDRRYHSKVKPVCGCRSIEGDHEVQVFVNVVSGSYVNGFSDLPFAFCVKFRREESFCTPFVLLFEVNRNITEEEVAQRTNDDKELMDCAEVDARPFLHYLQYLTYGGLGERNNQLRALRVFDSFMWDIRNRINLYHPETALNLIGHCSEMEGDYEAALFYCDVSLLRFDTNNAANRHVRRVRRLIIGLEYNNNSFRVHGIKQIVSFEHILFSSSICM
ncbi:hypothetical protein DPMN_134411 [Dreissena polymorpha]|uniref:Uncharacterized protein n=1 Tax=Dreissena polymorpha TaxID=45954 RepID=A0A9D4FX60_DREPO|nr:hypothetical protein DPMN_134411 [Dreissena polymorpha]